VNQGPRAWSGGRELPADSARPPPLPGRRLRTRRGRLIAGIVACAVLALGVGVAVGRVHGPVPTASCTFASTVTTTPYSVTLVQAQNAAVIAAVALRKGMPDHAVTIALAASLQESQLRNLSYGDLDSVGLFQQRPSEGWGTTSQIMDANYAASAFYDHLARVDGWRTMAVTEAAQLVQHSATPDAYATWEIEARSLARALTGEVAAGLSCHLNGFGGPAQPPSGLAQASKSEMGAALVGSPVPAKTGWQVATWAVAHAYNYHLSSVSFDGWTWAVSSGTWTPVLGSGRGTAQNIVTVTGDQSPS
jgi:hypothetical protein